MMNGRNLLLKILPRLAFAPPLAFVMVVLAQLVLEKGLDPISVSFCR